MSIKKKVPAPKTPPHAKAAAPEVPAKAKKVPPKAKHTEAYEQALKDFGAAVDLLRQGSYANAMEIFDALRKDNPDEPVLAERARTYATICARKLAPPERSPETAEELYFAGVVKANEGQYARAIEILDRAATLDASSASIFYARAAARALSGLAEGAASDLRQAVAIDPHCRFQAANDPDFDKVRDEAVFIDVIEPTPETK